MQKRNEAARNVKAMRDFLVKSGYTPEMIDTYLQEKGEQQKANMQRGVIALFFKESQFNIVPKALNQWKAWVQRRKLVK